MNHSWSNNLRFDPIPSLLDFCHPVVTYFTRRDLLGEKTGQFEKILDDKKIVGILKKQNQDGSWSYPKRKNPNPVENYDLLQTYRNLRILVENFGMDLAQPSVSRAVEYLFAHQSAEGDIRGIFGSQYAPHYSGGILELIIKAGYEKDPRVHLAFQWFESTRQEEGGWAWPLRTAKISYQDAIEMEEPVSSDYSKPFSHALTMFVIRAYAAHPEFRQSSIAHQAGVLVKSRFFQADKYNDRRSADYWFKFQYPYWWGNLLTALDSLSLFGFSRLDPDLKKGLDWFRENQLENGFWPTGYGKGDKVDENQAWVSLAICRVIKRFFTKEMA